MDALYGDLPPAKGTASSAAGGWTGKAGGLIREQELAAARKKAVAHKVQNQRPPGVMRPPQFIKRPSAPVAHRPQHGERIRGVAKPQTPAEIASEQVVDDQYDPMRPNDYAAILEQEKKAEQEAKVKEMLAEADRKAAEEERIKESMEAAEAEAAAPQVTSVAMSLMQKMGWSEGKGLGRKQQGILTPLVAKKTDTHRAVIVNAPDRFGQPVEAKTESAQPVGPVVTFGGNKMGRVVLLRNMVHRGQVDPDLEAEIKEECSRYGSVSSVIIFEMTDTSLPLEESVRIFVQFESVEQARKALVDLDGRFFGGQVVRSDFFDEDRFRFRDLGPTDKEMEDIRRKSAPLRKKKRWR